MIIDLKKKKVSFYIYQLLYDEINGSRRIGLGTGSTIKYFIDLLVEAGILKGKEIYVSSLDTLLYLEKKGFHAYTPITSGMLDIYVDGFDEVDTRLNLIKGRGAALHWEKQLALRSKKRIYIGDYTKHSGKPYLYLKPVPIEVSPPALNHVYNVLKEKYRVIIRKGSGKDGPVISDTGNIIVDIYPERIEHPEKLDKEIKGIDGVVETGIFPRNLVDIVALSYPDNVVKIFEA